MATKTDYYELTKPDGEDFYNVADFNGNADIIDGEMKYLENNIKSMKTDISWLKHRAVHWLNCTKTGNVFSLTTNYAIPSDEDFVCCGFKAPADYEEGNTFTVKTIPYHGLTQDGKSLPKKAFAQGAVVLAVLNTVDKKINFRLAGGGESFPAETSSVVEVFVENGTFTAPAAGNYRVTCIGKGGDGNRAHRSHGAEVYNVNGAGGGAGGAAAITLSLQKGDAYAVQVNSEQSAFGTLLRCTAGQNGSYTHPYVVSGGAEGEVELSAEARSLGAVVYMSLPGSAGEESNKNSSLGTAPSYGGDGGGYVPDQSPFLSTKGGRGGKTDYNAETLVVDGGGLPPADPSPAGLYPFGAGGGGGAFHHTPSGLNFSGGTGAPGAVIVEWLG